MFWGEKIALAPSSDLLSAPRTFFLTMILAMRKSRRPLIVVDLGLKHVGIGFCEKHEDF